MHAVAREPQQVSEEDALRAHTYGLLAQLLAAAPKPRLLEIVRGLEGDDTDFGRALNALSAAARKITPEALEDEYFQLFIGVGKGELLPYKSYYLTGFLNEWPAAELVDDMRKLGIARAENVAEPEDHIAALCEMMAGLIMGRFGPPADLAAQRAFFEAHIGNWARKFFEDLEAAKSAAFYMPVGTVGKVFMDIENEAFRMAA